MYKLKCDKSASHKPIFHKSLPIVFALIILTLGIANASAAGSPTPLSISSITPSNPTIDTGQGIMLTGTWSGGIAPYNAVWYTGPQGTTCPQEAANVIATYNGLSTTSNSITVSPTTANSYCLGITDSESPAVTQLSLNYTEKTITSGFNEPYGVAVSTSGTYAYVTNFNSNNVVIMNTATNSVTSSITAGFSSPTGVSFSHSGTYAYVANFNANNVVVINTATNSVTGSITSGFSSPSGISFSSSGTYAYVTNYGANNVVIINTATNSVIGSITSGFSNPGEVSFSPSSTYAYVTNLGSSSTNIVIINTATNTVTGSITSGFSNPTGMSFSPSGTYAYVTNYYSNNVIIINHGIGAETTNAINVYIKVNTALSATSITTFYPIIDSGHLITLNVTTPTTGTSPYRYQWYSGSSATCSSDSIASGFTNQSETFSPTSNTYYCAEITDSATAPESVYTPTFKVTVNPALSNLTITPSSPAIDSGQSIAFTASWSGGTSSYSASLYSSPTSTCSQQSTLIQQDIGISSNSVTFSAVAPTSNTYYCTYITDNDLNSYLTKAITSTSGYSGPEGMAFSHSGTYAYVANLYANNVVIINTATNTVTGAITAGFNSPEGVAISPSGTYAYVTNYNSNNVVIINTATNTVTRAITAGFNSPEGVAISNSGTYAYVTNYFSNNVVIINTATNTVTGAITTGTDFPEGVAISPSGTYAYVTNSGSGNMVIINTATNSVVSTMAFGSFSTPQGVAIAPSGSYAYLAMCNYDCNAGNPDNITIINTATNTVAGYIVLPGFPDPYGVAFSPDGSYAYVTNFFTYNLMRINSGVPTINSINNEVTVNLHLGVPTLASTPSLPSTQGNGNTITFTATATGGTSPYSYNYLITNTATGNLVANMLFTDVASTTNSFAWTIPGADIGNTVQANVIVTDNAYSPETANSLKSGTLTITYTPPSIPVLSSCPTSIKLDIGQTVSCSASFSRGTGPYAYNWLVVNSVTDAIVANMLFAGVPSTSNTFAYTAASADVANSPLAFNVIITDSHPTTVNSVYSSTFQISPQLSVPTILSSNSIITAGQSVTFSSTWSGGTPDYTAKLYSSTTSTCNTGSTIVQTQSSLTSGSASFNGVSPTSSTYYCLFVTDSATTPVTVNSINSEITINTGPQISNPYAGGSTGYFGPNSTLSSSTTYTSTSSSTSTILPVTTVTQITASPGTSQVCNDSSGYMINYPSLNTTINIAPVTNGCFRINVTNATQQSRALNRSIITALNYTVNSTNVSTDATLHYPCSIPNSDIAPFILRNGTWKEVTPFTLDVATCTVEFAVPADPVIALLNTNVTSTISTTTTAATTAVQSSISTGPVPQQNNSSIMVLILILIVVIVVIALLIHLRRRR